jgi:acyl-CoA thioester hydrolase
MPTHRDIPSPERFNFRCEVPVRFRDLDAMGHVNNAVYLTYFEVGREGYARAVGFIPRGTGSPFDDFPFILAEVTCRFLAPAGVGQTLLVHLRTVAIGRKSYEFEYLITDKVSGAAAACGRSVQVYYDYRAERTVEVPTELREMIERYEGRPLGRPASRATVSLDP